MNEEDQKLDQLLRQWRCPVEEDRSLGGEVWRRIADREETAWSGRRLDPSWLGRPLLGPALAATLFLGAILAGVGAAELRLQRADRSASIQAQEQAYFESINPVALARHTGHP